VPAPSPARRPTLELPVVVALFVGALLGYAAARAIDALGARFQRQAAARLARAEVRRLRGLLGPAGNAGAPGGAVLELLAAASGLPVRLHSAVERLLRRDGGLFADDALVLLLRLEDALRALEAELDRVWQASMADAADEALRVPTAAAARSTGPVAGHITPAAVAPGRAAAVRCVRAAQEVRAILDALEVAIAPPPAWPTRVRLTVAAVTRRSARALRLGLTAKRGGDAHAGAASEISADASA
jgi:hypothetical protein